MSGLANLYLQIIIITVRVVGPAIDVVMLQSHEGQNIWRCTGDEKITCSGGDGCRCRTCGPTRKLTRDVLTNLQGTFGVSSGNIRGLIGATSANS